MVLWYIFLIASCGIVFGLIIYLIFKLSMKERTFDEAMAEQRKKFALERNLRSKPKHNQSKKHKNVVKDNSQVDKRNTKTVSPQNGLAKETKKVEGSKNNTVTSVDKIDGNSNYAKKKNDKAAVKSVSSNPNNSKSNVENVDDDAALRSDLSDGNTKKKQPSVARNEDSSPPSSDSGENEVVSEEVSVIENDFVNVETEAVAKDKPLKAGKGSSSVESADGVKSKNTITVESNDKSRESKKSTAKGESDENVAKSGAAKAAKGGVVDEKPVAKENKSKQNTAEDNKAGRNDDKVTKQEELKVEEKVHPPSSPFKNKRVENGGVVENQTTATNALDAFVCESNAVKEVVVSKTDKSSSMVVASKKPNNAAASGGMQSGKMSPVAGAKGPKTSNNSKLTKRQANDIKTLQKLSDENSGPVGVNLLMPLIAKAELSRSEYQHLIDVLLNKQQENCIDAEWIEGGRQDPMVKLKRQLAEKEKALCDEQEAHQAIQSKLKELRTELNLEKHTNRQLEETLNARQMDLQALNARLQSMAEEKQNFTKQLQQLQAKLNEEHMIMNSLKDENSKTKGNLQHELLSQRQQLEVHIAHLNEQHQQEIMALEGQLNQLASQLQEQEATNAQMTDEIRECVLIRERLVHQENQIAHFQQTVMQLEELRPIKAELERHVANGQYEVKRLNNELQTLTDQLNRRNVEIEKFNCTVQNMKIENQELLKENSRNNEQIKFAYNEKAQLQMENEKLRNELQKLSDQCHSNDDVVRLENELESYRGAVAGLNAEITLLKERLECASRTAALEEENRLVNELKENLQKQMKKNDDLRSKNWKVMEALSSMEKTLEAKVKGMQCIPHEIKTKERELIFQQLKSVLPGVSDVSVSSIVDDDAWSSHLENILQEIRRVRQPAPFLAPAEDTFAKEGNMLDELEKQNKQLQTMVSHYKSIISDTEGMLNSLQNHVEREENRWSEQVQLLQVELNTITEERNALLNKVKIQNGCVQNDVCSSEQKVNGIDKLPPILPASSPINKTVMTS